MAVGSEDAGGKRSRREFVRVLGASAAAPWVVGTAASATAESPVARFHASLGAEERKHLCFPSDHPLRSRVANHWAIVAPTIGDLSRTQARLCREVFDALCSQEGSDRFARQMRDDAGGFERYHVALFGEPGGDGPFEWVLTGRHVTLRADGNSAGASAATGPIFYGHGGAPGAAGNVWWDQAEQARRIFATLDDAERARAVVGGRSIAAPTPAGLDVAALDEARKAMARDLLAGLVRPFRSFQDPGVRACLDEPGGAGRLRLTYYRGADDASGAAPDVWTVAGPGFTWSFHGAPHVHAWLNVGGPA